MDTPYKKIDLDATDLAIIQASQEVLRKGDKLYGTSPEDTSHIEWAIGIALTELKAIIQNRVSIATLIELGRDEAGFFISFLPAC